MTHVLRRTGDELLLWTALVSLLVLLSLSATSPAADLAAEEVPHEGGPGAVVVEPDGDRGRIAVVPDPPYNNWNHWNDGHPWYHHGAPRVQIWVDRGPDAVYSPGDRLWVFFRVDRPSYVTVIDYAPDGSVRVLFPNRWSGSGYVRPGRTYRIPESGRYSLRIAGPGGVETLVACAHEVPWPSGQSGFWVPPSRSHRGRVIVEGRSGSWHRPGRPGRVVVPHPSYWPVPSWWVDRPGSWSCDEVSFRVVPYGWYGDPWRGDAWYDDPWRGDPHGYGRDDDRHGNGLIARRVFTIDDTDDAFYHEIDDDVVLVVECTEGRSGEPTEIVGRIDRKGEARDDVLFRIDVEGRRGHTPNTDRVYEERLEREDMRLEIRVLDFATDRPGRWDPPVIRWIRFEMELRRD